ncbi:MAG: DMT family transporter [Proteobacteria bacterium]|nr:DMT family transporter [Pseudomonadota bacterium]
MGGKALKDDTASVSPIKLVLVMSVGIFSISFGSIFIRFASDVHPIMIATYRMVISSVILLGIVRFRQLPFASLSRRDWGLCALSGFFLALHFITWISSLQYTSVASSVVLVSTNPIFVGILSFLVLREKLPPIVIGGILLSIAGSTVLSIGDSAAGSLQLDNQSALFGNILALTGALAISCCLIIGSRLRSRIDLVSYITATYGFSALFLLVTSIALRLPFTGFKTSSYFFLLLLAVMPQLIGHSSYNWALKHLKSSMVAITTLGEAVCATLLAYLILHESLGAFQLLGILLIFAAILLASTKGLK